MPKEARLLRSYERVAMECHDCVNCEHPIVMGEEYIGEVWVDQSGLWVKKYHVFCPEDPEDWDEFFGSDEDFPETKVYGFPTQEPKPNKKAA